MNIHNLPRASSTHYHSHRHLVAKGQIPLPLASPSTLAPATSHLPHLSPATATRPHTTVSSFQVPLLSQNSPEQDVHITARSIPAKPIPQPHFILHPPMDNAAASSIQHTNNLLPPTHHTHTPTQCVTVNPDSFTLTHTSHTPAGSTPHSEQPQTTSTTSRYDTQSSYTSHSLSHIQHDPSFPAQPKNDPPTDMYQQDLESLRAAAVLLQQGQLVAMPTETVYGLAADALNTQAVRSIYTAKGRPSDNPLIVHISSLDMLYKLYPPGWTLPDVYIPVVAKHWPGPLTILLPRSDLVSDAVVCGHSTMAIRLPAHPVARALIALSGTPLAAPSANSSGRPSPTLAAHVMQDMQGRIPLVVDGGGCGCGVESTVLDGLRDPPVVLRPGGVTAEQLEGLVTMKGLQVYQRHFTDSALEQAPTTPGMKYRHYSPTAPVTLLDLQPAGKGGPRGEETEEGAERLRWLAAKQVVRLVQDAVAMELGVAVVGVSDGVVMGNGVHGQQQQHQEVEQHQQEKHQQSVQLCVANEGDEGRVMNVDAGRQENMKRVIRVGVLRTSVGVGVSPGLSQGDRSLEYGVSCQSVGSVRAVEVVEYVLGDLDAPAVVAQELFLALRLMDQLGVGVIVAEGVTEGDEGLAVMNRLRKAASRMVSLDTLDT